MNDAVLEQFGTFVSIVIFDPLGECFVLQDGHNFDFNLQGKINNCLIFFNGEDVRDF